MRSGLGFPERLLSLFTSSNYINFTIFFCFHTNLHKKWPKEVEILKTLSPSLKVDNWHQEVELSLNFFLKILGYYPLFAKQI